MRAFYQRYYVARNAVVAIIGAVDRHRAEQLAEQVTAQLSPGEHTHPPPVVGLPQKCAGGGSAFSLLPDSYSDGAARCLSG